MSDNDASESANRSLKLMGAVVAIVVVVLIYYLRHPSTVIAADGLGGDWDMAIEHSRETHKPMLVLFTADWCPGCRALHSDVLSRDDVNKVIAERYTMLTVDLTNPSPSVREHASQYGISGIPTLIRFDADGKETGRTHYIPPQRMIAWLGDGE